MLNEIQAEILRQVADMAALPETGAVNLRSDGERAFHRDSEHVHIVSKTDKPGIDIHVDPGTKGETVHIPVVITKTGIKDLVYNDFFIGEGAEVKIVAGCGIHTCGGCDSEHDGIHTFHVGKGAKVTYLEKHYGEGDGVGKRILNPQTILYLEEGATVTMDTSQIRGVDDTKRYTRAVVGENAEIVIQEKLLIRPIRRISLLLHLGLDDDRGGLNSLDCFEGSVAVGNNLTVYFLTGDFNNILAR